MDVTVYLLIVSVSVMFFFLFKSLKSSLYLGHNKVCFISDRYEQLTDFDFFIETMIQSFWIGK